MRTGLYKAVQIGDRVVRRLDLVMEVLKGLAKSLYKTQGLNGRETRVEHGSCPMIQMHAEEGSNIWRRRGREEVRARGDRGDDTLQCKARMGSVYRPRDSGNLGDIQNRNWAEDEVVRGPGRSSA